MPQGKSVEKDNTLDRHVKPRSISRRLTIGLVLTITIVAITTTATIYLNALNRQKKELSAKADEYLAYLIGSLGVPLWNVDVRTIKVIGLSVAQNELIVRLSIKDSNGDGYYNIEKEHGPDLIKRSGQIFYQGKFLGEVSFSLTKKFYQKANRSLLLLYGISFLVVIFALVVVTGLLVRRFLKRPLKSLNDIVESYADGIYDINTARLPYMEFIPFEGILSKMGDKIQSQMDELKHTMAALRKAHDEMEVKVADRTAELLEAKERAESANRAKSTFISTMNHELRTPLNAIFGFSQLIARSPSVPVEHKEQLELITRSGEHLLSLINNVLDMSKIEAGRTTLEEQAFDLGSLIDEIEHSFRLRAIGSGLKFNLDVAPAVPRYVSADEVKIRQVLINLLGNALKFTAHGMVSLKVDIKAHSDATLAQSGGDVAGATRLCFVVEDSGPGIAAEELDSVFEAFVQTRVGKRRPEGTGLGLALSKQFAELMGGALTVHSEVDKGSVFLFEIPITAATAEQVYPRKIRPRVVGLEQGQSRYRILVVDEAQSSCRLVTDILNGVGSEEKIKPGFDVRQAGNGQEALEIWRTWQPHLIWMDMRLPVMDGYEATRQIKATAQGRTTTIIGLSASAFEEQRSAMLSAGCDGFMRKPFQISEFFDMMHQHLGVRYIYEDKIADDKRPIETPVQMHLITASLCKIPDGLLMELHRAVRETHPGKTQSLIMLIAELNQPLAAELSKLTTNFRFDLLQEILEENL